MAQTKEERAAKQKARYEANKEAALAYQKAYREANIEKILAYKKAHYEANKEEILAKQKAYKKARYEANREEILAKSKAYREANREEILAKSRAYREANREEASAKQKAYYEANREKLLASKKSYKKSNKERVSADGARRRALKRKQIPVHLRDCPKEKERLVQTYRLRNILSQTTGVEHHVDHMWPLSDGGPHWSGNLQVIPAEDNLTKGTSVCEDTKGTIIKSLYTFESERPI